MQIITPMCKLDGMKVYICVILNFIFFVAVVRSLLFFGLNFEGERKVQRNLGEDGVCKMKSRMLVNSFSNNRLVIYNKLMSAIQDPVNMKEKFSRSLMDS